MSARRSPLLVLASAAGLALLSLLPARAAAESALLTKNGTLYEVYSTTYGLLTTTDGPDARSAVLALRTTPPNGDTVVEVLPGTLDANREDSSSLEYDETTHTLFVVYTQHQNVLSDVRFAMRRDGRWSDQRIAPNIGFYMSLNPRLLVTRQRYTDWDGNGGTVAKSRSILSVIWWEEASIAQARYAAVFVEDGSLDIESAVVVNLNDLSGVEGPASAGNLPFSAYQFPAIQKDPAANGGLFVSFANLVTQRQEVFRISFPDDLTKLDATQGKAFARGHIPVGGRAGGGVIPKIDTGSQVGTVLSPSGAPTFFWQEASGDQRVLRYLRGDDPDASILSLPLRPDFGPERALDVLRDMVARQ